MSETEIIEAFRGAMHAAGIRYTGPIEADGELHRVHLEGDKKGTKNGWFVLHLNGKKPAGAFGSHKGDFRHAWKADQPAKQLSKAELKRIQDDALQREKERKQREARAAQDAKFAFDEVAEPAPGDHPYLKRKGIEAHSLRWLKHAGAELRSFEGWLIMAMRDAAGDITTLEFISPAGEKRFLPGGRKVGSFYPIGEIDGAEKIILAEGFATGASVREATGLPVVVAADCGNLAPVAEAIRTKFPKTKFVFAADNDIETASNPGMTKAIEAARTVGGLVAVPTLKDKPGARCDFNDLHLAEGLDRVRELIEAATSPPAAEPLDESQCRQLAAIPEKDFERAIATVKAKAGEVTAGDVIQTAAELGNSSAKDTPAPPPPAPPADKTEGLFAYFIVKGGGLYYVGVDRRKGVFDPPIKVSSYIEKLGLARNQDGHGWSTLIRYDTPDGDVRTELIPNEWLQGEAVELARKLADMGVIVWPKRAALLAEYLITTPVEDRVRVADRTGWFLNDAGAAFVLPDVTIGDVGEKIILANASGHLAAYSTAGTLSGWSSTIGRWAVGNSRMITIVSAALAAVLLEPLGIESGNIELLGDSSTGKSTLLFVAAGMWGKPSMFRSTWRQTDNHTEAFAASRNDAASILDEKGQASPLIVDQLLYMLAQGQGKGRVTTQATIRRRHEWRTLVISSAEVSTHDMLREAKRTARAGMELRHLEIPADAGAGMGVFEAKHDFASSGAMRDAIEAASRANYGHPARAFIEYVIKHRAALPERWREHRAEFEHEAVPENAHGQVRRAADRLALISFAGLLAAEAGIVPWTLGASLDACSASFRAWLAARGGSGNSELIRAIAQVREWFQLHAEGRLADWDRTAAEDDHAPRTLARAGFRKHHKNPQDSSRVENTEFYVLPDVWNSEICRSFNAGEVARELLRQGHLHGSSDRGKKVPYTRVRLPGYGKPMRCYHFADTVLDAGFGGDEQDLDDAAA